MSRLGQNQRGWRQPFLWHWKVLVFLFLSFCITMPICFFFLFLSPLSGCPLLRLAHPQGRGQSGAGVILPARPLQPPLGGLPERWANARTLRRAARAVHRKCGRDARLIILFILDWTNPSITKLLRTLHGSTIYFWALRLTLDPFHIGKL